jgi:hypothetical protein
MFFTGWANAGAVMAIRRRVLAAEAKRKTLNVMGIP